MTTKSIGATGRNYSTLSAWASYVNALTLSAPEVGEMYNDGEFTESSTVTLGGWAGASATNTVTLKCAAGQSFRDNAAVKTNALRYNQSNGVGIASSVSFANAFNITGAYCVLDGLQIRSTSANAQDIVSWTGANGKFQNSLISCGGFRSNSYSLLGVLSGGGVFQNLAGLVSGAVGNGFGNNGISPAAAWYDCTVVTSAASTGVGFTSSFTPLPTVENCTVYGFTTDYSGTCGTSANNATDKASFGGTGFGTSGQTSITSAEFVSVTSGSEDLRLASGSTKLKDHGATVGPAVDIAGTTRPQGSAYDIGCWEYGAAPSGVDLGVVTIANTDASTQTNAAVTFGVPIAPGKTTTGNLMVYDDDGSGGKGSALANFQVSDSGTDMNGDTRFALVTAILPSIAGSSSRKLHIEGGTGAPTGTAIAASDVTATSFANTISFDIAGTVYTFDTRTALAAAATFSKTGYMCVVRSSGPTATRFYVAGPPLNAGSPHASGDGLRVCAEVTAYKAGAGAVSGGNPILRVEVSPWVQNGDVARTAPAHYYYGYNIQRSTSLSVSTLINSDDTDPDGNNIKYSYPRSQPAATLTAPGATSTGWNTWTISAGSWDNDIVGAHITSGSGRAIVTSRTNSTTVGVYVYAAFAGTSFASGSWTIEGIGHHYGVCVPPRRVTVGQRRTCVALWGNVAGVSPTGRQPMDYLALSQLYPNNVTAYPATDHSTTALDRMRGGSGAIRPLTFLGSTGTDMGSVHTDIGSTGNRPDIGPVPGWDVLALCRYNSKGRRLIFENAEYFSTWQFAVPPRLSGTPSTGSLGVTPRADNGTTYKWNNAYTGGSLIAQPATTFWPYSSDGAHHPDPIFFAYLMTGDLYWMKRLQEIDAYTSWVSLNDSYNGTGIDKTTYGDAAGGATKFGDSQTREKAWTFRTALHAWMVTPDSINSLIGNVRSYHSTRVQKHWTAIKTWGPSDTARHPGTNGAPQWIRLGGDLDTDGGAGGAFANVIGDDRNDDSWQMWMNLDVFGHGRELGTLTSDGLAAYQWLAAAPVGMTDSGSVGDIMTQAYKIFIKGSTILSSYPSSFDQIYQRSVWIAPIDTKDNYGAFRRSAAGTITISSTTAGSTATMNFSNAYFTDTSYYVGGYVSQFVSGTAVGLLQITAVNSATSVTGTVVKAFTSTTLTGQDIRVPGYSPSDYGGQYSAISSGSPDYAQKLVMGLRMARDAGITPTTMDSLIAYMTGRTNYTEVDPQFEIAKRT